MKHQTLFNPILILSLILALAVSFIGPSMARANGAPVEFFDNFASYAIGSNPTDVYEYHGFPWSGDPEPAYPADLFQIGAIGSNQVLQYHWGGPSYHFPRTREIYRQKFSALDEAGISYLYTQQSMAYDELFFEYQSKSDWIMLQTGGNEMYVGDSHSGSLGTIDGWPDKPIMQLDHRMEAKRLSDTLLQVSLTRLDTNEKKTLTVVAPRRESSSGYSVGFGFYEDWGGGVYVDIDDFYVKGVPFVTEFNLTGSMNVARSDFALVPLCDGRALAIGGSNGISQVASAEIYDPATGGWTLTRSMIDARSNFGAVRMADCRVLVTGGDGTSSKLNTAEIYDPATGTWSWTSSLLTARGGPTPNLIQLNNGKVLITGGGSQCGTDWCALASSELYDPAAGTWSATGALNTARGKAAIALLPDGRVLIAGGMDRGVTTANFSSAEVYNPTTGVWTNTGNMAIGRREGHSLLTLPNGKVLVAGGTTSWTASTTTLAELYDPATGVWTPTTPLSSGRSLYSLVLLNDGNALMAGGRDSGYAAVLNTALVYSPSTQTWIATANTLVGRRYTHQATVMSNGSVLLAGGYDTAPLATAELYAPQLAINPTSARLGVGGATTVYLDLNAVANLYGYQFQVNYDAAKVSASGAFVNTWFDTVNDANVPLGWNAACAAGVCKFAASKTAPGAPVSGSGHLASITFAGIAPGPVPLTFSSDILSDRNGQALAHSLGAATLTVYGYATVNGSVNLQGRPTPGDGTGTVTLTDLGGIFSPLIATINPNGSWSIANVPVMLDGSNYQLDAAHSLYLGNRLASVALTVGGTFPQPPTTLKGGDANNDRTISVADLSCIGGAFGGPPTTCGATGSSDINADGTVNILDLVLAGGNYGLSSPQPW